MASPRMLEQRAREAELRPRVHMLTAGPTSTESIAAGFLISTNRKHRLAIERKKLTRAQRLEIKQLRSERRMTGVSPKPPSWAKYEKPKRDVRELAEALATVPEEEQDHGRDSSTGDAGRFTDPIHADDTAFIAGDVSGVRLCPEPDEPGSTPSK